MMEDKFRQEAINRLFMEAMWYWYVGHDNHAQYIMKVADLITSCKSTEIFRIHREMKALSRFHDEYNLVNGIKTQQELRRENAKFSFPKAVIDWSSAKRLW